MSDTKFITSCFYFYVTRLMLGVGASLQIFVVDIHCPVRKDKLDSIPAPMIYYIMCSADNNSQIDDLKTDKLNHKT